MSKVVKGRRYTSYSWAELGTMFRAAKLAGNESLAVQLKQAIALKKEIASRGKAPQPPIPTSHT